MAEHPQRKGAARGCQENLLHSPEETEHRVLISVSAWKGWVTWLQPSQGTCRSMDSGSFTYALLENL